MSGAESRIVACTLANVTNGEPANPWAEWMDSIPGGNKERSELLDVGGPNLTVRRKAGETWLLLNEGPSIVYMPEIEGLTDLDKRRLLEVALEPASLGVAQAKEFVLVSRYSLSGPASIVVSFRLEPGGPLMRRVLDVPAE